ncbi:hypothetical protein ACHHYP_03681 [Achlya hypogyna]|uniref:Uncharacterized protein n=1 Tax=Achlya hypogyna TaxID=1202772 RepID=A0A1V9Z390_ACHHY|nr:hypothetical protein ACHHYP_03681 [Achlya hypogyna]
MYRPADDFKGDSTDSDLSDSDAELHTVESTQSLGSVRHRRSSVRLEPRRPSVSRNASNQLVRTPLDLPAAAFERLKLADVFQDLCFSAHTLRCDVEDLDLWFDTLILSPAWRTGVQAFLEPLCAQLWQRLDAAWAALENLRPPFHRNRLVAFEVLLRKLDAGVQRLDGAIADVKAQAMDAQQELALLRLQTWCRDVLAKRHFYSVKVQLRHRHHRGLIPGLFDSLCEESVMTINPAQATITVEYPKALDRPGSPRHRVG